MDMQLNLRRNKEKRMSRGIIQAVPENDERVFRLGARELSPHQREVSSKQPTLADLVLPGTGHRFLDEFARLLGIISAGESA
jgi:hypothetical protein